MMGKLTRTYLVSPDTVHALYVMYVHILCTYVYFIYVRMCISLCNTTVQCVYM